MCPAVLQGLCGRISLTIGAMERYEIRTGSHLGPRTASALGCAVEALDDGDSVLTFDAIDQAALYGLLSRLRDLGIELVAVEPVAPAPSVPRIRPPHRAVSGPSQRNGDSHV